MNSPVKPKNNKALFALVLVFILPVAVAKLVLSMDLYNGAATNKGQLIPPEVSYQSLSMENPHPQSWQLLYLLPKDCLEQCQQRLYVLHQSHVALGKHQDRVSPIIMLQPDSDTAILEKLKVPFETANASQAIIAMMTEQQMIIVDPLGSLVMEYPGIIGEQENMDQGKSMIADLRKLLKLSRVG
ncbi:hypothetical protein BCU84_06130 [Shewanella sp. 10N.286.51.B7]|uniref:hypothetical protein n=1 Tax=unclassified Shewanella TaxID=196818 RepID=UPI000C830B94|nr:MULTISPECIES: hypothetical protein [unclassified Shewanella]MCC4833836.1 hypothetical protein [Shewanella sp. 10N.7]PMG78917.1 hypothetical protein BCU84_06130 [Shewanella sp. 10N.286.51.B7]